MGTSWNVHKVKCELLLLSHQMIVLVSGFRGKKKKWRRYFGNIPCDRKRELLICEDQGCRVSTSLVSWSLNKDRFWTLSNKTGWLFSGISLMCQHLQVPHSFLLHLRAWIFTEQSPVYTITGFTLQNIRETSKGSDF